MNYTDLYGVEYSEDRRTLLRFSKEQTIYVIPEGTVSIGASAFKDCDKLTKLCMPVSLKTVGSNAFAGCKHLRSIEYSGSLRDWLLMDWRASIECAHSLQFDGVVISDIVIPEGIGEIKAHAFYYCTSIRSVIFNDGLTSIGASAFNKSSLSGDLVFPKGLKFIGSYAFFSSNIKSVAFPSTLDRIDNGAFSACYSLESFSMFENGKFKVESERFLVRKAYKSLDGDKETSFPDTIFAFAGANVSDPVVVPSYVKAFAYDTFCFNTLGKGGIWIKHEMYPIAKGVFREAKGKIYVLPKLRRCYNSSTIPKGLVEEKFDQQYAFKSDNHQVTALVENPFRVLGVYANASQKDITANARKIKRYLEVGKDIDFPTDLNSILPPIKRTEEMIDKALADISTTEGKWKNALFWFVKVDDLDEIALGHLQANNIGKAKDIWSKKYKWNYQLNLSSLSLLSSDIDRSSSSMYILYDGLDPFVKRYMLEEHNAEVNYEDFLRCVIGDYNAGDIHHSQLEYAYLDGLLIDVDLVDLRACFNGNNTYLNVKCEAYYQDIINSAILAAKSVDSKDSAASRKSIDDLIKVVKYLYEYEAHFGDDNENYKLISDNFANQLLQAAINYYNSATGDYDEEGKIIADEAAYFAGYAELFATSQMRKERCEQNMEILERNADRIPPKALLGDKDKLEELLASYIKTPETISQAYALLKDCAPIICHIKEWKEKPGNDKRGAYKLLENTSTAIVNLALNKLVAEVNRSTKSNTNVFETIRNAREVMMSMACFPMMDDFRKERFDSNSATLDSLYLKASPLGQIGLNVLPNVAGTYPLLNVNTDEEVWKSCKKAADYRRYLNLFGSPKHAEEAKQMLDSLDDVEFSACKTVYNFENYLRLFPHGKHQGEAEAKLQEFKDQKKKEKYAEVEKEVLKYIVFALVLVIFNTVIYATCTNETFGGWVMFSCIAYAIKLGYDTFTKYI